jgi:cytochrome c biogenesis protein ResB
MTEDMDRIKVRSMLDRIQRAVDETMASPLRVLPTQYSITQLNALPNRQKIAIINMSGNNLPDLEDLKAQGRIHDFKIEFTKAGMADIYISPIQAIEYINISIKSQKKGSEQ